MSLSAATSRSPFTGDGATSVYAYSYLIQAESHLLVTVKDLNDAETTLVLTTDYTVDGVGAATGGNITLVDASQAWLDSGGDLLTDFVLVIRRVVPITQTTDIRNQGSFFPETHEDTFDFSRMIDQQQQDLIDRSMTLPETSDATAISTTLPLPVASRAIGWNATADALSNIATAGTLAVSPFMETVLDDITAPLARVTLDAAQLVTSATADTPAIGDELGFVDISDSNGENKAIVGAVAAAALSAGWLANIGLAAATTTTSADSIKIQGAAAALSATNPLYVNLPSTTAGLVIRFTATADVTIDLTGAHFGFGTRGDLTDRLLTVYAINDNGTVKFGVSDDAQLGSILDTDSSATGTSVTAHSDMLVNTTLTAGTWPCHPIGKLKANFDDTGGASEDLWAVQTGDEDLVPSPLKLAQETVSVRYTGSGGSSGNASFATGATEIIDYNLKDHDTHNAVTTGASWSFAAPISGKYLVTARWRSQDAETADALNDSAEMHLYKNTAIYADVGRFRWADAAGGHVATVIGSVTIDLAADDTLDLRLTQDSGGAITVHTGATVVWCSIDRIGD